MAVRPRYLLLVEVCPDRRLPPEEPDCPPAVTLRRACKLLWRGFRVRVVRLAEAPPQEKQ